MSTDEAEAWREPLAGGTRDGAGGTIVLGRGRDPAAQVPLAVSIVTGATLTVFCPWIVLFVLSFGPLGIIVGIVVQY